MVEPLAQDSFWSLRYFFTSENVKAKLLGGGNIHEECFDAACDLFKPAVFFFFFSSFAFPHTNSEGNG